ncbi:MAG: GNAT family N-acetyltransferase [Pirellulales bacterium]|nr:GNAT family N-acetyltransferase [Pirellulales bacterium]
MPDQPILETPRLLLRPLALSDAKAVQRLAGDAEIARMTLLIPHPYPDGAAEEWIVSLEEKFRERREVNFAVTCKPAGELIGVVCLRLELEHDRGELGYWIGKAFWASGYATEAARAAADYGFATWNLHRVYAHHFGVNPASGRVLQKLGLKPEGRLRQHVKKGDRYEDMEIYGLLREEWNE